MFKEYMDRIARAAGDIEVTRGGARVKMDPDKAIRDVSKKIRGIKRSGGKVMIVGNGGSASIASHQTIDLWKNCGVKAMSFNEGATLTCLSNDLGYEKVFERPVAFFAERGDCLIAISSSGMSKNILNAAKAGRRKGMHVVTLSGFGKGNKLRGLGHVNFYVPSSSYGVVEITHLSICHAIVDSLMA